MAAIILPSEFPRRLLVLVTGLSPQVVTETLYALTQRRDPPFMPTEVHLVTTAEGAERARLTLLSEDPGWYYRLCRDYGLSAAGLGFNAERIHVLADARGQPLRDIRSEEENEQVADAVTDLVRGFTADPEAALHVSIAGGRKTMGYYAGYALSLLGRVQDRLSHVLVSAPYEANQQFYYPTPYSRVIYTPLPENRPIDARDAAVTLAEIPFVRLREGLPPRLLSGQAPLTEIIAAANRASQPPRLVLDLSARRVLVDEQPVELGLTEFAFLLWLAERARGEWSEVDWTRPAEADAYLAVAQRCMNPMSGAFEALEKAVLWRKSSGKDLADYFEPQKSRVNKALTEAIGPAAARRYAVTRCGPRGQSRYFLPLSAEQIEIVD